MSDYAIIYHAGCPDGFTGAWVFYHWLLNNGKQPELLPVSHGDRLPNVRGKHVYMVDICLPKDKMVKLVSNCKSVLMLDHHETAAHVFPNQEHRNVPVDFQGTLDKVKINNKKYRFETYYHFGEFQALVGVDSVIPEDSFLFIVDQRYSGAQLAAKYCRVKSHFVDCVEDNDLHKFEIEASRQLYAAVACYDQTIETWDMISEDSFRSRLIDGGNWILKYQEKLIDTQIALAQEIEFMDHKVLGAPAPYSIGSMVAGRLAEISPSGIGMYWIDYPDGVRKFGLRSTKEGPDVAILAERYRVGGGHFHASGFTTKYEMIVGKP